MKSVLQVCFRELHLISPADVSLVSRAQEDWDQCTVVCDSHQSLVAPLPLRQGEGRREDHAKEAASQQLADKSVVALMS